MSDEFHFNDDDDILLNSICTPLTSVKRLKEQIHNENGLFKKHKLEDCTDSLSPEFKLQNKKPNSVKRIFPGPAGILADENQIETCSQRTSTIFQDGPWEEMSKDFKISSSLHLYDKFNIAWIKKEATTNQFANRKAPFLAAILLSLEVSDGQTQKSVNVTLKDTTGTIQGNILYSLYEKYANHFILGSVLILIQFGVLSCTCDKCDNYHLTITPKNLSAIYNSQARIVIKKIEPQEVLSDFIEQQKEPISGPKNETLTRQNNSSNSPAGLSNVCSFSVNNKSGFHSFAKNKFLKSPDVSASSYKNGNKEALCPLENKAADNVRIGSDSLARNDNHSNPNRSIKNSIKHDDAEPKRKFTFKKVRLPEETHVNLPSAERSNYDLENKINVNCSNKLGKTDVGSNNVKIARSGEISVKVDNAEHEEIWKDILDNVDINSLFDDDF